MKQSHRILKLLVLFLLPAVSVAQSLSLTFDDGLDPAKQQRAHLWNEQLIAGLKEGGVKAILFPSLSHIGTEAGMDLVREWGRAGHNVGNHTSKHRSLSSSKVTLSDFIADVREGDAALLSVPGFVQMLRFPFLKEGESVEKRDGIRQWMKGNGYVAAGVSIDTSDWYYNQIFVAFTDEGSLEKAGQVQRAYIDHLLERAAYYDGLAKNVLGRSPKHVMLLHVSAINAASIGAIIATFRARGWQVESPRSAFTDPMYAIQPNNLPAGESIVWALAKERGISGLRYPGEDSTYEEPKLRELGLLP